MDDRPETVPWRNSRSPGIDYLFGRLTRFRHPDSPHPILGTKLAPLYRRFTGNGCEAAVYLGYVTLTLALCSIFGNRRAPFVRRFAILAATFLVFSLGPILQVAGHRTFTSTAFTIPLPAMLFPHLPILDMMRTPNRMSILVVLSLSTIAPVCLVRLRERFHLSRRSHCLVVGAATLLVIIDSWNAIGLSRPPPVPEFYHRIARERSRAALLEVPAIRSPLEANKHLTNAVTCEYYYAYQFVHHHPLFGGYFNRLNLSHGAYMNADPVLGPLYSGTLPDAQLGSSDDRRDYLRNRYNIEYVVLHKQWLTDTEINTITSLLGSRVYEDGSVTTDPLIIYDLSGSRRDDWAFPQLAAWRGAGWYGSEALPEGAARWMNDHGVIEITSNVEDELELRFEARSVSGVRTLRIAWSDSATSFSVPRDWTACSMRLAVHPGITTLHLVVPEGSVRPIEPASRNTRWQVPQSPCGSLGRIPAKAACGPPYRKPRRRKPVKTTDPHSNPIARFEDGASGGGTPQR